MGFGGIQYLQPAFAALFVWLCSGDLHGALEEKTDATQLYLGPDGL